MFRVKRVYDPAASDDGARYLVDRLWPRGVSKASLRMDGWAREASPSDALRREFHKAPEKWNEFRKRYFGELDAHPEAWRTLAEAGRRGRVTLLYAAKDTERNNAVALAEYLDATV